MSEPPQLQPSLWPQTSVTLIAHNVRAHAGGEPSRCKTWTKLKVMNHYCLGFDSVCAKLILRRGRGRGTAVQQCRSRWGTSATHTMVTGYDVVEVLLVMCRVEGKLTKERERKTYRRSGRVLAEEREREAYGGELKEERKDDLTVYESGP